MRSLLLLALFAISATSHPLRAQAQDGASPAAPRGESPARIQPGDQVALKIWNEPEMSDTFHVASTGEVVLPRLGAVKLTHLGASEARDTLRIAYTEYLRNPAVEVTILRRVGVLGEVRKPDLYFVDITMTLRDVIARAGGITEQGNPNRIEIIRGEERIPLRRGANAGFLGEQLHSGDQIVVGRRNWFELNSLAIASTGAVVASVVIPLIRSLF